MSIGNKKTNVHVNGDSLFIHGLLLDRLHLFKVHLVFLVILFSCRLLFVSLNTAVRFVFI